MELLGGTKHVIPNVQSWKQCREHCKNNNGLNGKLCHYYQWWDASANNHHIHGKRRTPYDCELKTDAHCGKYGSNCVQRKHEHGVAGSVQATCPY